MATAEAIDRISRAIIGGAIEVHRRIGPGCLEYPYSACLAVEFQKCGLDFTREVPLSLAYDGLLIQRAYIADFIVEGLIVVEIKALAVIGRLEQRQLQTYLRLSGCPLGLLVNFGAPTMTAGIKRIVNHFPEGTAPLAPEVTK